MTAINQRVVMWRGDTKTIRIPVLDKKTRQPVSLEGASAHWWLAKDVFSKDALIEKTSALDGGITIIGNLCDISLVENDTKLLDPGNYYHELEITLAGGQKATATVGSFVLNADFGG